MAPALNTNGSLLSSPLAANAHVRAAPVRNAFMPRCSNACPNVIIASCGITPSVRIASRASARCLKACSPTRMTCKRPGIDGGVSILKIDLCATVAKAAFIRPLDLPKLLQKAPTSWSAGRSAVSHQSSARPRSPSAILGRVRLARLPNAPSVRSSQSQPPRWNASNDDSLVAACHAAGSDIISSSSLKAGPSASPRARSRFGGIACNFSTAVTALSE
mmetsp:Transcript_21057/g.69631  ORF Transcript_21057/g.69631 Transcript_21057/m.69631 type:complete len:218 (-) Transcript_21057:977-1630(-)